ncbi:MAG: tripartite tricarboxylate transporter substrate binding protein [Pseudomonadota bacterium]
MNTQFGFSWRVFVSFLFGILSLVLTHGAQAQSYPGRPVRVIMPYPPGAVGDIMMRTVGQRLMEILGHPFIIDNRAGGGGMAATEFAAKSTPDGHTLLFNGPNHVTNLGLYPNVPYDPVADFAPITHVASSQTVLVAHASTGLKTVQQLVDAAKAKPMGLNYASSGAGTGTHLSMEMLMRATGTKLTHVSFRGGSPAAVALVAGQVQVGFTSVPLVLSFIKDGRLLPLAVGGSKRLSALPDVSSLADLGMLNYDVEVWFGLLAPKSTPAPVVSLLAREIRRILYESGIPEKFEVLGFTVVGSTPAEFDALIKKELQRWPKLIRELGIQGGS